MTAFAAASVRRVRAIDSHTGGEPTRVVVDGGPDLGTGSMAERLERFRRDHDRFRSAVVTEPRGSDVLVGALLLPPEDPACTTGMIFFNNVGYLGMCGHATIGLMVTLAHLGRIQPGKHRLETPVGVVEATLQSESEVTVTNVPSYRKVKDLVLSDPTFGRVIGDVAWGGNWFFLCENHGQTLSLEQVDSLCDFARRLRRTLNASGHPEVDHIELFGPPQNPGANSRSFVLCPGGAYDRSPCGTGTSAKLACLAADGKLAPGERWVQESIVGSRFVASYERQGTTIVPSLTGSAFVNAETTILLNTNDPLCWGIGR